MRIQQLEYLERIVEAGSINEAAKRLFHSAQPVERRQRIRKRNGNSNFPAQLRRNFADRRRARIHDVFQTNSGSSQPDERTL